MPCPSGCIAFFLGTPISRLAFFFLAFFSFFLTMPRYVGLLLENLNPPIGRLAFPGKTTACSVIAYMGKNKSARQGTRRANAGEIFNTAGTACRAPTSARTVARRNTRGVQRRAQRTPCAPRRASPSFAKRMRRPSLWRNASQQAGGINRYGETNYRAVWGWNRLAWIGGKFEDRDQRGDLLREVVELRREPKYPAVNRWHIERWMPPESYGSPRQWYAQTVERENGVSIPALGPYPYRGDYEHCFTLQTPSGAFVQLTAAAAEHIAHVIEFSRKIKSRKREARSNRSPRP